MRYFFVFAHPEPNLSFNAALLKGAVERLKVAGHEVEISDLYGMGFNPVASAQDFERRRFPDRLQYDREQKFSVSEGIVAPDIQTELQKLLWCDTLVFQFPLYWFSMPAILKGWIDRVFLNTVVYGAGKRYETGGLKGRRAIVATTTGAYADMFAPDGLLGDFNRALWHIHNGVFHYTGLTVLPPFVGWSPIHGSAETNEAYIEAYAQRLLMARETIPLQFHQTSEFDDQFRLKLHIRPRSDGHWRPCDTSD
jgi:NAD(P)H dehydrogenase (quinone)